MKKIMTLPNVLTLSRGVFLPVLFIFMKLDMKIAFLIAYAILGATDFVDGKLARYLDQVTYLGQVLDSICDLLFYISTAYFMYAMFYDYIRPNMSLLWVMFAVIALSIMVSIVLFRKPAMMHTVILRLCAMLVYCLMIFSFIFNTTYMMSSIIVLFIIGFIEATIIFIKYGEVNPDTPSILSLIGRNKNNIHF